MGRIKLIGKGLKAETTSIKYRFYLLSLHNVYERPNSEKTETRIIENRFPIMRRD